LRLNECKLSASRTAAGRLFHTTGPATEKALSPNFVLVVVQCSRCLMPSGQRRVWIVNITSASLSWILYTTGSQCSSFRAGRTWSRRDNPRSRCAAAFWTRCYRHYHYYYYNYFQVYLFFILQQVDSIFLYTGKPILTPVRNVQPMRTVVFQGTRISRLNHRVRSDAPQNSAHLQHSAHARVVLIFYGIARSVYEIARSWVPGVRLGLVKQ